MSNKTLYVRDEDDVVWEKARDYAGESLSSFITNYLKNYVAFKEVETEDFKRIVIQYRDVYGMPLAKAFKGRWLIDPSDSKYWQLDSFSEQKRYALAISAKGNFVIISFDRFEDDKFTDANITIKSTEEIKNSCGIFPPDIIATVMERGPIPIEELDI